MAIMGRPPIRSIEEHEAWVAQRTAEPERARKVVASVLRGLVVDLDIEELAAHIVAELYEEQVIL